MSYISIHTCIKLFHMFLQNQTPSCYMARRILSSRGNICNMQTIKKQSHLHSYISHIWMGSDRVLYADSRTHLESFTTLGYLRATLRQPLDNSRTILGQCQNNFRTNLGQLQDKSRITLGQLQDKFRITLGQLYDNSGTISKQLGQFLNSSRMT